jgi:hypothetical protein
MLKPYSPFGTECISFKEADFSPLDGWGLDFGPGGFQFAPASFDTEKNSSVRHQNPNHFQMSYNRSKIMRTKL